MQAVIEREAAVSAASIYAMRYSGATLKQIADKIGKTKERVRQILIDNYGSTRHKLVSTRQLVKLSGLSRHLIIKFCQDNVITPVRAWDAGNGHRLLWPPSAVEQVTVSSWTGAGSYRLCRICRGPVPDNRHCYCSEVCYQESHKYKYRSVEAREKHRISMKKYQEGRRQLAQAAR